MGREDLVDLLQHFGDPQLGCFRDRRREILPEAAENVDVIGVTCRHVIQLALQIRGELIAHIAAEIVREESSDQAALILGEQAVLFFADVFAVLNGRHDRGIGRRPADPQLFHAFDQRRLGIAGRGLGVVLQGQNGGVTRQDGGSVGLHRVGFDDLFLAGGLGELR